MADIAPSATLAGIREDIEATVDVYDLDGAGKNSYPVSAAMVRHARALLAALSVAIAFHVEAVVGEMPEPGLSYCATCSGHPAWPCPEVRAITTALTGEERTDG